MCYSLKKKKKRKHKQRKLKRYFFFFWKMFFFIFSFWFQFLISTNRKNFNEVSRSSKRCDKFEAVTQIEVMEVSIVEEVSGEVLDLNGRSRKINCHSQQISIISSKSQFTIFVSLTVSAIT